MEIDNFQDRKNTFNTVSGFICSESFEDTYGSPVFQDITPITEKKISVPTRNNGDYEIQKEKEGLKVYRPHTKDSFTLSELLIADFAPIFWHVERLITQGVTLLWGAPKSGKSILILQLLLAVVLGRPALRKFEVKTSSALFISLEDGGRRLQKRVRALGAENSDRFHIATDWERGTKGLEKLDNFLSIHSDVKIVAIDTLFLFSQTPDVKDYSAITTYIEKLKRIAEKYDIAIILIHHSRKRNKEDANNIFETALGSTGIVSGPDHLLFLKKTSGHTSDAILYFRSKDEQDAEMNLYFDTTISGWTYAGEASEIAATHERQEILDIIRAHDGPIKTDEIHKALGEKKSKQAVSNLLSRMIEAEILIRTEYGQYDIPNRSIPSV